MDGLDMFRHVCTWHETEHDGTFHECFEADIVPVLLISSDTQAIAARQGEEQAAGENIR